MESGTKTGLQAQLVLVLLLVSLMGLLAVGLVGSHTIEAQFKRMIAKNARNIALLVAEHPDIKKALGLPKGEQVIQPIAEKLRKETGVKAIIIIDNDDKIYSHPISYELGAKFQEEEEGKALDYLPQTKESQTIIGPSIRSKAPIIRDGIKVGEVIVDALVNEIQSTKYSLYGKLLLAIFAGLVVSVIAAASLAKRVKNIIYGMEPSEIALLLKQREGIIESIREGIIAIDSDSNITLINSAAKKLFGIDRDITGQPLEPILPGTALCQVVQTGKAQWDMELNIRGKKFLAQLIPIYKGKTIAGAIGSFRDLTEVRAQAEQMTGVALYVEALRAQNHEFKNKLQAIAGLIQLEEYEKALSFISEITSAHQSQISFIAKRFKNPSVGGILLGKSSRCSELGIDFQIDPDSFCSEVESFDNLSLIMIIGNLLENAIEAVQKMPKERRKVYFGLFEESGKIIINVRDYGMGIEPECMPYIFEKGYSTKEGSHSRGYGLYNVKNRVEELDGDIEVESTPGEGTDFIVTLPHRGESDGR